jgi:hypothetical protein
MERSAEKQQIRDRFFTAMVEAIVPLKTGPDPEVTLEMLLEAVDMLKGHVENELEELRQELTD